MKLPAILPDKFLECMTPEDRRKLGRAGITREEAQAKFRRGEEHKLQRLVYNWLNLHQIYFDHDRMDRRTSGKVGRADFRICVPPDGIWLSVECKPVGETLSREQAREALRLRTSGGRFVIAYSLQEVIEAVRGLAKSL